MSAPSSIVNPLDAADPLVFENAGSISSFDGAVAGKTGLINNGSISATTVFPVNNIANLRNVGSISDTAPVGSTPYMYTSSAVRFDTGGVATLGNSSTGVIETNLRFGVFVTNATHAVIDNAGRISGGDDGIRLTQSAVVHNSGIIEGTGNWGRDFNVGYLKLAPPSDGITQALPGAAPDVPSDTLVLDLSNDAGGVIRGVRGGVGTGGGSVTIDNAGTITGVGNLNGSYGLFANGGDRLLLTNTGTISQTGSELPSGEFGAGSDLRCGLRLIDYTRGAILNSGTISGVDVGIHFFLASVDINNAAGGLISGGLLAISSITENESLLHVVASSALTTDITLPFDTALLYAPLGEVPVLMLPEIAAETGAGYLLPRFELQQDGLYHPVDGSFPLSYTRPDGTTATIDPETGLIQDASGRTLTLLDLEESGDILAASADYVVNAGTLEGGVNLGIGNDVLQNSGTITGLVSLESGNDRFSGALGSTGVSVDGGSGDDTVVGGSAPDTLSGGLGNDTLSGGAGADQLIGGAGNDTLMGGAGRDNLAGGAGNDVYIVSQSDEVVTELPGQGIDAVQSGVSFTLRANVENLSITGSGAVNGTGNAGNNRVSGNDLANTLKGLGGNDLLFGRGGNDNLQGGIGNDTLAGGFGLDTLSGGDGSDQFRFDSLLGSRNVDQVTDFSSTVDKLVLDNDIFTGFAPGAIGPGALRLGSAAADADDRLIYDQSTGTLYYDADGNGTGSAMTVAVLTSKPPSLVAADFIIVD